MEKTKVRVGDKISVKSANMDLRTMSVKIDVHSDAEVLVVDQKHIAYSWYDESGKVQVGICRVSDAKLLD